MSEDQNPVLSSILKIVLVDAIAVLLVGAVGGFGSRRAPIDYAYGFWIAGVALMTVGFLFWRGGIDPRTDQDMVINYWNVLGVEKAKELVKRERFRSYRIMDFWFMAGLLPFGIGTLIAVLAR